MDIYLTELENNDRIRFPMLPESISVQNANIFQSYRIMARGDVKLPFGQELTGFTWSGKFPGEARKNDPYVREWQSPHELLRLLETFRTEEKKLRLLITETSVNHDVYIRQLQGTFSGGYGDFSYNINMVLARELVINESGASASGAEALPPLANTPPDGNARPDTPTAATYTVVSGDTLWGIAQRFLGAGRRYSEIHAANRDVIGSNPGRIFPGQILTIPA